MADSSITKKALAMSLKSLLSEQSFEKISVSDICDRCDMNRKSFYYHFHDKYELVNWIFDTEFIRSATAELRHSPWDYLQDMCNYLYENRVFYRRALKIEGQNSFAEHFKMTVADDLTAMVDASDVEYRAEEREFIIRFYSNMLLCSLACWLGDKDCDPPQAYVQKLRKCAQIASGII